MQEKEKEREMKITPKMHNGEIVFNSNNATMTAVFTRCW